MYILLLCFNIIYIYFFLYNILLLLIVTFVVFGVKITALTLPFFLEKQCP